MIDKFFKQLRLKPLVCLDEIQTPSFPDWVTWPHQSAVNVAKLCTHGSVLGPMLFTMYIKPLSAIIDSHSIIHHSFADDLQLQMSAPPDRIPELLHSIQSFEQLV